jgi:putative DNA primase/helicase
MLLGGLPMISIDNLNGDLGGDLICQAVERPLIQIRPLGTSDLREIENSVTLYATGNGLRVRGDMTRRTLVCTLDPMMERPEMRQFQHRPLDLIQRARGQYVAAGLTIARAFMMDRTGDRPDPFASFSGWSNVVRGALMWLGCDDPLLPTETARDEDPELMAVQQFLTAWKEYFPLTTEMTVPQMVEAAEERGFEFGLSDAVLRPAFRTALVEIAGDRSAVNTRRLGKWLASRAGRVADGLRLVRGKTAGGGYPRWSVAAA